MDWYNTTIQTRHFSLLLHIWLALWLFQSGTIIREQIGSINRSGDMRLDVDFMLDIQSNSASKM